MAPFRLLHLIHTPRHSGAEMLVYELCRVHRAWGHDCAVASFAPSEPAFHKEAGELKQLGVALFFPERAQVKLGRTLYYRDTVRRFQPNAVFGHSELPSQYGRFATGWGEDRVMFVSVMHSVNDATNPYIVFAERITRFRIDHLIAVCDEAIQKYLHRYGRHIPFSVIGNGIDIARFAQVDRPDARRRLGVDGSTRLVLQVGRIYGVKQQLLSLYALRPLLAAGKASLWFVGLTEDHAYELRLRNLTTDWGLDHAVRFLGSRVDVPDLLAAADLYLMPSAQEAQGIALLEALASGVPVIASDIPPFRFARDMPSVRICGVSDESAWRAAAHDLLAERRATRNISQFSIERAAQAYLNVARLGRR